VKLGYLGGEEYAKIAPGELEDGNLCYVLGEDGKYHPKPYESTSMADKDVYKQISPYGIRIKDHANNSILETKDADGTLWLRNKLHIGTDASVTV
jgi:hypothetical protein